MRLKIQDTAIIEKGATLGAGTQVWHFAQVRTGARIGRECILGKSVFIDAGVRIGDRVKIQNNVSIYSGVRIESGVFVGPHVCFTNDKLPRAVTQKLKLKGPSDWIMGKILVKKGASIGANATIVTGVTIGRWSMIGAGSVVTREVPDFALVQGNPARIVGYVNEAGRVTRRTRSPRRK